MSRQFAEPVTLGAGVAREADLMVFVRTIAAGDLAHANEMVARSSLLATARLELKGATRQTATDYYLEEIGHYMYRGDTALHIAAASYQPEIVRALIAAGAEVRAKNRRGAEPLHYVADGQPGGANWRPDEQAATIPCLIHAGADPNATDRSGVRPLHRAVRTRCAAAVAALLDGGADPLLTNKSGSTAVKLATQNTGRGGSGSFASKAQQEQILRVLERYGVTDR